MKLRSELVRVALPWERLYGVAPSITSALSEFDAAVLLACSNSEYREIRRGMTAVTKGYDLRFRGKRYQIKANRPSGKRGSVVTLVSKPRNYEWDYLMWILYDREYNIREAWLHEVSRFRSKLGALERLRPVHLRTGRNIIRRRLRAT
jgi:hypothetical protein